MTKNKTFYHQAVMPNEVVETLQIKPGNKYIDATLGGGGHALKIIKSGGELLGIDRDPDAIAFTRKRLHEELSAGLSSSYRLVRGNFKNIASIAQEHGFEQVDGILMDIGLSSYHLDQSGRGFSYRQNEPLDMRMNPQTKLTAFDVVNSYDEQKLYELFLHFGETHVAQELARSIASARGIKPIVTTDDLVQQIERAFNNTSVRDKPRRTRVLAMVFQAIRIEVNQELENLKTGLVGATNLLNKKGRLVIITFHSLEDRIVKLFFKDNEFLKDLGDKLPQQEEIEVNSRARSARLRVAEKQK